MKKSIIIICFISLQTTVKLEAFIKETEERGYPFFGLKAGLNSSNVWDEQGQDFVANNKPGFVFGMFAGIPVGKLLGFQPEIMVSQKGFQGSGTSLGNPYSFSRTTTYLDIPLQLQIKPVSFLTFVVGPQYSFLLHQKDVFTNSLYSTAQEQDFNNENRRRNILGAVIGADINIENFVLSGRFGWDFQTNHGDGTSSTPRYKNQWLQLTAGFRI